MPRVNIEGLEISEVINALYQGTQPIGMGYLHFTPGPLPQSEIDKLVKEYNLSGVLDIDYLLGRPIKIVFIRDRPDIDIWLYDRDAGQGKAQEIISALRDSTK